MKKKMMNHGFIMLLILFAFAVCGAVKVSAEEESPVIALGKDVTVTYNNDHILGDIRFYPENTGYQCYRITGTVIDASSDIPYITASASYGHEGWSDGSGIAPEDNLRKSNPKSSFWTTLYKKDGDEPNFLIVNLHIPYDWQDGYDPNAFITVKWHIEKLIGLQDPDALVQVTLSQKTLYYSGTGEKPKPTVTSVTVNGKKLKEGIDYRVSDPWYLSDTEGGITVFGEGGYGDLIREYFTLTSNKEEAGKKDQPMTVKANKKTVKFKKLKKKNRS